MTERPDECRRTIIEWTLNRRTWTSDDLRQVLTVGEIARRLAPFVEELQHRIAEAERAATQAVTPPEAPDA